MDDSNITIYQSWRDPNNTVHAVLLIALFGIIIITGTIGNSLVILAVLLSKKLRTATNAFVVNLAVADLLSCLTVPIILIHSIQTFRGDWLVVSSLGVVQTVAVIFILPITVSCSIFTLMGIALNRLLLITLPSSTYRKIYAPKKLAGWLVAIWVLPTTLSLITIAYDVLIPNVMGSLVRYMPIIVLFAIPLSLILACYALIWRRVKQQARRLANSSSPISHDKPTTADGPTVAPLSDIPSPSDGTRHQAGSSSAMTTVDSRHSRYQIQITKNMFCVVCAFVLCVGPAAICLTLDRLNIIITNYALTVVLINSCINPLIYATKHRDFKTVFRCIVRRQWDNIPEPTDFLKAVQCCNCCGPRHQHPV